MTLSFIDLQQAGARGRCRARSFGVKANWRRWSVFCAPDKTRSSVIGIEVSGRTEPC
jgi:hypothetical protein